MEKEIKKEIEVVQVAKEVEPRVRIKEDIFTVEETLVEILIRLDKILKAVA